MVLLAALFGPAMPPRRATEALAGGWPEIADAVHIIVDGVGAPAGS